MIRGHRHVARLDGLSDCGPDSAPGRSRWEAGLVFAIATIGLWLGWVAPVLAAALPVPPGWESGTNAAPEAQQRAREWANAWQGEVRHVIAPSTRDNFIETVAVLELRGPMPAAALEDVEQGRAWLEPQVARLLGTIAAIDGDTVELRARPEPGVSVLQARVDGQEHIAWVAFAPRGAAHVAVVLQVRASEEVLYTEVFDDTVAALAELRPPIAPFARSTVRWAAAFCWLLIAGLGTWVWTRRSLPRPGARVAGRQVAAAVLAAAAVVVVIAGLGLGVWSLELGLADSSPWGLAAELGAMGLLGAGLALVATEVWARRLQPVASAPHQGSFAAAAGPTPRHPTSEVPQMPAAPGASGLAPAAVVPNAHSELPSPGGVEAPASLDPWDGARVGSIPVPRDHPQTGDTVVGPPPSAPADVPTGRAHGVSGDTVVGPAPAAPSLAAPAHHQAVPRDPAAPWPIAPPSEIGTERLVIRSPEPSNAPSEIATERLLARPRESSAPPSEIATERLLARPRESSAPPSEIATERLLTRPRESSAPPSEIATERLLTRPREPSSPVPHATATSPGPAITGQTQIGPPPTPYSSQEYEAGPPPRDVVSGDIEVKTQVRPNPVVTSPEDGPASLIDAHDPVSATATASAATPPAATPPASGSGLFPAAAAPRGPNTDDSHPALDMPLPPRKPS